MKTLTAGFMGLAIAAGIREVPAHVQEVHAGADAPLSLHLPTPPDAAPADLARLGAAVWPPAEALSTIDTYNVTRNGIEIEMDSKFYFLSGEPRAANCHADVNGTYGRSTIGFVKASCPTQDNDKPQPEKIYNTYRFLQSPNRTYLERPPVSRNTSLCVSVRGWDPVAQQHVPLQGELVQPLSMRPFVYEETCTAVASAAPTPAGAPRNTSVPVDPVAPETDDVMTYTVTSLAVVGTVVGASACLYQRIVAARLPPAGDARAPGDIELQARQGF